MFLLCFVLSCNQKDAAGKTINKSEVVRSTIKQIADDDVLETVKVMQKNETQETTRNSRKITSTKYFYILGCGNYSATSEAKGDTIFITVNNSQRCDGERKFYKLETVITNPRTINYKVKINEAFTFLSDGERLQKFKDSYPIGDINGDKTIDTAVAEYEKVVKSDGTIIDDCGKGTCYITIKFGKNIPDIRLSNCYGIGIEALKDINGDGRDEIIMASHYFIGSWHEVLIWSYDGEIWNLFSRTKVYDDGESDASRVVKENGDYYIKYQTWDIEGGDIIATKKKIEIKNIR